MEGELSFGDGHRSPHVSASLRAAECPSRQLSDSSLSRDPPSMRKNLKTQARSVYLPFAAAWACGQLKCMFCLSASAQKINIVRLIFTWRESCLSETAVPASCPRQPRGPAKPRMRWPAKKTARGAPAFAAAGLSHALPAKAADSHHPPQPAPLRPRKIRIMRIPFKGKRERGPRFFLGGDLSTVWRRRGKKSGKTGGPPYGAFARLSSRGNLFAGPAERGGPPFAPKLRGGFCPAWHEKAPRRQFSPAAKLRRCIIVWRGEPPGRLCRAGIFQGPPGPRKAPRNQGAVRRLCAQKQAYSLQRAAGRF